MPVWSQEEIAQLVDAVVAEDSTTITKLMNLYQQRTPVKLLKDLPHYFIAAYEGIFPLYEHYLKKQQIADDDLFNCLDMALFMERMAFLQGFFSSKHVNYDPNYRLSSDKNVLIAQQARGKENNTEITLLCSAEAFASQDKKYLPFLEFILKLPKIQINQLLRKGYFSTTRIFFAIYSDTDPKLIKLLLDHGADPLQEVMASRDSHKQVFNVFTFLDFNDQHRFQPISHTAEYRKMLKEWQTKQLNNERESDEGYSSGERSPASTGSAEGSPKNRSPEHSPPKHSVMPPDSPVASRDGSLPGSPMLKSDSSSSGSAGSSPEKISDSEYRSLEDFVDEFINTEREKISAQGRPFDISNLEMKISGPKSSIIMEICRKKGLKKALLFESAGNSPEKVYVPKVKPNTVHTQNKTSDNSSAKATDTDARDHELKEMAKGQTLKNNLEKAKALYDTGKITFNCNCFKCSVLEENVLHGVLRYKGQIHVNFAKYMLDHPKYPVDINVTNKDKRTYLHFVAKREFDAENEPLNQLKNLFLNYGDKYSIDVNAKDKDGNTPLHLAGANGNAELVAELLKHKADYAIKNNEGLEPYDYAARECKDSQKKSAVLAAMPKDSIVVSPPLAARSASASTPVATNSARGALSSVTTSYVESRAGVFSGRQDSHSIPSSTPAQRTQPAQVGAIYVPPPLSLAQLPRPIKKPGQIIEPPPLTASQTNGDKQKPSMVTKIKGILGK